MPCTGLTCVRTGGGVGVGVGGVGGGSVRVTKGFTMSKHTERPQPSSRGLLESKACSSLRALTESPKLTLLTVSDCRFNMFI